MSSEMITVNINNSEIASTSTHSSICGENIVLVKPDFLDIKKSKIINKKLINTFYILT